MVADWYILSMVAVWLIMSLPTPVAAAPPRFNLHPSDNWMLVRERLALDCRAEGEPTPTISWLRNGSPLESQSLSDKWETNGGRLIFQRLQLHHAGNYSCLAKNDDGEVVSRTGQLRIDAPASIANPPTNRTVAWGTVIHLECRAVGMPTPAVYWLKNGKPLEDEATGLMTVQQMIVVNATQSASYTCVVSNHVVKRGYVVKNATGYVTVLEPKQSEHGVCTPYTGNTCTLAPAPVTDRGQGQSDQSRLLEGDGGRCRHVTLPLLCHLATPTCAEAPPSSQQHPLPLCREYCTALQYLSCADDLWKSEVTANNPATLPDCHQLPSALNDTQGQDQSACYSPDLFSAGKPPLDLDPDGATCYVDDGSAYRGSMSHVTTGAPCKPWPSALLYIFHSLGDASHHCRNPGGLRERPWCFTSDDGAWDYCDIKHCADKGTSVIDVPVKYFKHFSLATYQIIIIVGLALLVVCTVSVLACAVYHWTINRRIQRRSLGEELGLVPMPATYSVAPRLAPRTSLTSLSSLRNNNNRRMSTDGERDNATDNVRAHLLRDDSGGSYFQTQLLTLDNGYKTASGRVKLLLRLGHGAFGRVFLARLVAEDNSAESSGGDIYEDEEMLVAAKTLREDAAGQLVRDFEREAAFVSRLDHKNIVQLLGVCSTSSPRCLIFEYMNAGDLHHFLMRSRAEGQGQGNNVATRQDSSGSDNIRRRLVGPVSLAQQLSIGAQVASAMRYFSSLGYVHRDLATRNCLVHIPPAQHSNNDDDADVDLVVKLADFELARPLDPLTGTFEGKEREAIPVRWLPFECIVFNVFSVASDLWSYGVLLWEIFSLAQLPYAGLTFEEVARFLGNGRVLAPPSADTPPGVYDVMLRCWQTVPEQRPSFNVLYLMLERLQHQSVSSLN